VNAFLSAWQQGAARPLFEEKSMNDFEDITLPRSGKAPLAFRGQQLAEHDGHRHLGREHNRWHELAVCRTEGGRFVVRIAYRTCWQGEADVDMAEIASDPAEVSTILCDYNPCENVGGFPSDAQYRDKQQRLLADIRRRYEAQVRDLLASDPVFAERVP
jgi:hypothetical protein